jgi:hypothetical protein
VRRFTLCDWAGLHPADETQWIKFWDIFDQAWRRYQSLGPRKLRHPPHDDLFGRGPFGSR